MSFRSRMRSRRRVVKQNTDITLEHALTRLTDSHLYASNEGRGICEVSAFHNIAEVKTKEQSDFLEEPIGAILPVVVLIAHGEKMVGKVKKMILEMEDDTDDESEGTTIQ